MKLKELPSNIGYAVQAAWQHRSKTKEVAFIISRIMLALVVAGFLMPIVRSANGLDLLKNDVSVPFGLWLYLAVIMSVIGLVFAKNRSNKRIIDLLPFFVLFLVIEIYVFARLKYNALVSSNPMVYGTKWPGLRYGGRFIIWGASVSSVFALVAVCIPNTEQKRIIPQSEKYARWGYAFITPWIIGFLVFTFLPMAFSVHLAFTEYDTINPPKLIGFANFVKMFTKGEMWHSLWITVKFGILSLPLGLVSGFLLAYLLNMKIPGMKAWRTIFYLPAMISGVVVAMLWRGMFDDQYGMINFILRTAGLRGPQWLLDPNYTLYCFLFLSVWGCGGGMVVYLSGLQSIPTALYEAAEIDGCSKFQQLLHVTVPQMTPIFFFNLIMGLIGMFQYFAEPMVLTKGGPADSTMFYNLYLYKHAFTFRNMGYASALAWFLFAIVLVLTLLTFKSSELWVFYESEVKR